MIRQMGFGTAVARIIRASRSETKFNLLRGEPLWNTGATNRPIVMKRLKVNSESNGILFCKVANKVADPQVKLNPESSPYKLFSVYFTGQKTETFTRFLSALTAANEGEKWEVDPHKQVCLPPGLIFNLAEIRQQEKNPTIQINNYNPGYSEMSLKGPLSFDLLVGDEIPAVLRPVAKVWGKFDINYSAFGLTDEQIKRRNTPIHRFWKQINTFSKAFRF